MKNSQQKNNHLASLAKYVAHSKRLASCKNYLQNSDFQMALTKCNWMLNELKKQQSFSIGVMNNYINSNKNFLYKILPNYGNPSYESSMQKLTEIINKAQPKKI